MEGLRAIVSTTDELMRCQSLDEVYRCAVENARKLLGLERCSIFILDKGVVRGTFGTNCRGETTDEHAIAFPINRGWREHFEVQRSPQEGRWSILNQAWLEWDGMDFRKIGNGPVGITPIFRSDGMRWGVLCNDNAISGTPLDPARQEMLVVYASLLSVIFEQKEMGDHLRKVQRAVEQSPSSIIITDVHGHIEYINPKFTQITGYAAEEMLGKNPLILTSGEMKPEDRRRLWDDITSGREWRGELHNRRKNGELFLEMVSISPVRNAAGKITHFIAIEEDITEYRELQCQLLQAQKMEALGQLAGGVAHDFNNVLGVILGYSDLTLKKMKEDDPLRPGIVAIRTSAERAVSITRQLLAYSRKQTLVSQVVDLNAWIERLADMIRNIVGSDIEVVMDLHPGLGRIRVDPHLVEQAFYNLLSNARDAMDGRGRIILRTGEETVGGEGRTTDSSLPDGVYVTMSISDSGCGMTPEVVSHLFEPFFTTKPQGKGTGLGLSMVHGIVRQNGGHILVKSEPGRGSDFKLYFPKSTDASGVTFHIASPPAEITYGGESILVVEDEDPLRQLVVAFLRECGYQIAEASNGAEAMELFSEKSGDFDMVFTDIVMPKMGGLELAGKLRLMRPSMRILFSSGYTSKQVIFDQRSSHPRQDFLPKPYELGALARRIREILDAAPSSPQGSPDPVVICLSA